MINQIHLQNFKSHKNTDIALGNITFLCGQNGVGKSSIIQSLLLLRQSFLKNRLDRLLSLNSPLCYVGNGVDVLYQYAENDEIVFGVSHNDQPKIQWIFDASKNMDLDFINIHQKHIPLYQELKDFSLFNTNFQYISAARLADYKTDDYAVDTEKQISVEEGKAELTAHFLFRHEKNKVHELLLHPADTENNDDLLHQVTLWQREISKGVNVLPRKTGKNYEIKYNFNKTDGEVTNEFNAKNVGFGLSYTLPIIVAILAAQKDALILIENPEAHLHPYAQAKIAELMCIAAQAGIQIVVETHSDHIINGALVACKQEKIAHENIKIYQFERDEQNHAAKTTAIQVLKGGKIDKQPAGFFDQIEHDLKIIMGF